MKIPRDLDATELIKVLKKLGYQVTRQVGSHIRVTTTLNGVNHITIPNHKPLRIGTLNSILNSIAEHHNISKEDILK